MSAHSIDLTHEDEAAAKAAEEAAKAEAEATAKAAEAAEAPLNPDDEERAHMRLLNRQATILLEDGHRRNKGPLVAIFRSMQEILEGCPTTVPQQAQTGQKRGRDCDPEPKKKATHTCSVCGSAKGYGRSLCPYGCRPVSKPNGWKGVVEEVD